MNELVDLIKIKNALFCAGEMMDCEIKTLENANCCRIKTEHAIIFMRLLQGDLHCENLQINLYDCNPFYCTVDLAEIMEQVEKYRLNELQQKSSFGKYVYSETTNVAN